MSRFCVFWIKNTMRKVSTVVPVLITNCHVSDQASSGPLAAHATMIRTAPANAQIRLDFGFGAPYYYRPYYYAPYGYYPPNCYWDAYYGRFCY